MIEYIVMALALVVIIFLLHIFIRIKNDSAKNNHAKKFSTKNARTQEGGKRNDLFLPSNCPLCKTPLLKGEDLFSKVFRPMTVSDQRCIILGCPHCYPRTETGLSRKCPVCHKNVPQDGHLVSRLFNKTKDGKKHVVVTGCSVCCKYEIS